MTIKSREGGIPQFYAPIVRCLWGRHIWIACQGEGGAKGKRIPTHVTTSWWMKMVSSREWTFGRKIKFLPKMWILAKMQCYGRIPNEKNITEGHPEPEPIDSPPPTAERRRRRISPPRRRGRRAATTCPPGSRARLQDLCIHSKLFIRQPVIRQNHLQDRLAMA